MGNNFVEHHFIGKIRCEGKNFDVLIENQNLHKIAITFFLKIQISSMIIHFNPNFMGNNFISLTENFSLWNDKGGGAAYMNKEGGDKLPRAICCRPKKRSPSNFLARLYSFETWNSEAI